MRIKLGIDFKVIEGLEIEPLYNFLFLISQIGLVVLLHLSIRTVWGKLFMEYFVKYYLPFQRCMKLGLFTYVLNELYQKQG